MTTPPPSRPNANGPGDPEFDAESRRRWLILMREVLPPSVTDAEFDALIVDLDKIKDEFVSALAARRSDAPAPSPVVQP